MEQYKPNLGEIPAVDARRDAVHIAVAPVVAAHELLPRTNVSINDDGHAEQNIARNPIGIVDPFLHNVVAKGQRFWLFLYPDTITNLRHVWEHPAFRAKPPEVRPVYPVTEES